MGRRRRATGPLPQPLPPATAPPSLPAPPPNTPTGRAAPVRRQPVVLARSRGARCAEVAGGTAADFAAVCCCCPCGILSLLLLAVVKVPAGLCRRAFLKRRKGSKGGGAAAARPRLGLLGPRVGVADEGAHGGADDEEEFVVFGSGVRQVVLGPGAKGLLVGTAVGWPPEKSPSAEVSAMDKQMWAHFYGAGFWRSPSQREEA
uniref:Uncharacterized protein n=1 Tax=Anthurium amnicola TaxID=1678845 RepID=A0A1D1ZC67_9ARAE